MAKKTLAEQLRQAAHSSGLTAYRIAKETGITEPTIGRFMRGETTLSLDNAEKVMNLLGFQVVPPAKGGKR